MIEVLERNKKPNGERHIHLWAEGVNVHIYRHRTDTGSFEISITAPSLTMARVDTAQVLGILLSIAAYEAQKLQVSE